MKKLLESSQDDSAKIISKSDKTETHERTNIPSSNPLNKTPSFKLLAPSSASLCQMGAASQKNQHCILTNFHIKYVT